MKYSFYLLVAACICSFTTDNPKAAFEKLKQLAGGTWVMQGRSKLICEQWKIKDNNTLSSNGFSIRAKDTIWQERVELVLKSNHLSYISAVANQNEGNAVAFKYTGEDNGVFTFSNAGHDFPQHINYEFINKDSLHAWINGKQEGKEARVDFYYRRK
ncbi:DUF6265 family protein [Sediminibacterium soli]|uniref:DUF6265 family protein n=1 Tax=Sediminibacterium soli TaxID=2698829 RepID=UPI001379FA4C|nr:DUF6265 family protein [Sediminibacterium soli]NCI46061.1 hypothetical protein [Sediminibacterium soli]